MLNKRNILPYLASLLAALLVSGILLSQEFSGSYWTGWYPLLVPQSQVSSEVEHKLAGLSDSLVSGSDRSYFYDGFDGLAKISRDDLVSRRILLDKDPRLDPFLINADRYFKDDLYEFFYLPADRSSLKYKNALKDLWQPEWIFPDCTWDVPVIVLSVILSVLMLAEAGRRSFPGILMLFYTAGSLYYGNHKMLIPGLLFLFLFSQYRKAGKYRLFLIYLIPLSGLLFLLSGVFSLRDTGAVLLIFLSGLTFRVTGKTLRRKKGSLKRRDHDLFRPVSLTGGNVMSADEKVFSLRWNVISGLLQGFGMILLLFMAAASDRSFPVSFPAVSSGAERAWSWSGLKSLPYGQAIPGVKEMVMHRAYQESFSYGGTWMMPVEGDTVNLKVYTMKEGRIDPSIRPVLTFDQKWLEKIFDEMPLEGPGVLLKSEPFLPEVSLNNLVMGVPLARDLIISGILLILGILLNLLNIAASPAGSSEEFRMRNHLLIFRRKQQAA